MKTVTTINEVRKIIQQNKLNNKTIGLVPTMGALHEGHLSLIRESKKKCDYTVISIFVNPIQFGPKEDFNKYPRNLVQDEKSVKFAGADLLFTPDVKEMIGEKLLTYVDIKNLGDNLCGAKRPGHFRGVCTIVSKLFNIVEPDIAFFGKKDIQQLTIIKKMTDDLNFNIKIIPCQIIREEDGLAMSSRNRYLNDVQRKEALILYNSLKEAVKMIELGEKSVKIIIKKIKNMLKLIKSAKIDYVKIVNENMEDVMTISKGNIIALAVFIGKTRLIDNHIIGEDLC